MDDPKPESVDRTPPQLAVYKWQPGQSGNPKGRPRRPLLSDELTDLLEERVNESDLESKSKLRALAEKLLDLALDGNCKAIEILAKVIEPKRPRVGVAIAGDVNVGVNEELLSDFLAELPQHVRRTGLPQSAIGSLVSKLSERVGPIPEHAGNRMIDAVLFEPREQ